MRKLRNMVFPISDGNSYQRLHKAHVKWSVNFRTISKEYDCIHDGVSIEVVSSVPSFDECLAACDTHNADPLSTSTCTHVRYTPSTAGIVINGGGAQEQDSRIFFIRTEKQDQNIRTDNLISTNPKSVLQMTYRDVLIRQMIANFLKIQLI